jgi:stage II sporulation protein R
MRMHLYLLFIFFILLMSFESQKEMAAVFAESHVPQESIRLRILANSDSPQDQQIKRIIRDRVIASVSQWSQEAQNIEEARRVIRSHLPELRQLVRDTLQEKGFTYASDVQLGPTEFPTKMYGAQVFPAGTYEAVLITLGKSQGSNWWCVMFPPLCFVDISTGDTAVEKKEQEEKEAVESIVEEKEAEDNLQEQVPAEGFSLELQLPVDQSTVQVDGSQPIQSKVELRFFFIEKIKEIVRFFS